jgi:hypothetical protein
MPPSGPRAMAVRARRRWRHPWPLQRHASGGLGGWKTCRRNYAYSLVHTPPVHSCSIRPFTADYLLVMSALLGFMKG